MRGGGGGSAAGGSRRFQCQIRISILYSTAVAKGIIYARLLLLNYPMAMGNGNGDAAKATNACRQVGMKNSSSILRVAKFVECVIYTRKRVFWYNNSKNNKRK